MEFEGKTVLVTGAGRGIGRAITQMFAKKDAKVIAVDLRMERLEEFVDWPSVVTVHADISSQDGVIEAIDAAGGKLDVLCNNAGIIDRQSSVDETTNEEWERLLAVNLTAPFQLSREAARMMIGHGGGVIVNTGSIAGLRGGRAGAAYTATKWGLIGLTKNIAATLGGAGIRCNAVCPGETATTIAEDVAVSQRGMELLSRDRLRPEGALPEQIASVVVFLASEEASHINGAAIPIDNGYIAF